MAEPIGGTAVMHSHNTLVSMAQKYHLPMWKLPSSGVVTSDDAPTISGNRYEGTKEAYQRFAEALLERTEAL
jgi:hypothetical protein